MTRRYLLNPCDCVFAALAHWLEQQGLTATGTFMTMELEGDLSPAAVARGLDRAMQAHPPTRGAAAVTRWRALPCWDVPAGPIAPPYACTELAGDDWAARADALFRTELSHGWDPGQPPQVRLSHVRGPGRQHRLYLRWPHALMDAEGAQYFLAEIDRLGREPPGPPFEQLLPGDTPVDPLADVGRPRRLGLMLRGIFERSPRLDLRGTSLCPPVLGPVGSRGLGTLVRTWDAGAVARIQAAARALGPPGPALHSRYLAGCVLRAVARLHAEHGCSLPFHGTIFPMRMPGLTRRPLWGNYLTAAPLSIPPAEIDDPRAVAAQIHRQLTAWLARGSHRASWALQAGLARLRIEQYRRLLAAQTRGQPYVTGFALYGEIDPPIRSFLGATVTNLYGSGVISIPPGWNVTFSRFADRLNLVLAWPEAIFPPELVRRYADLIEAEAFGSEAAAPGSPAARPATAREPRTR